MTVLKSRSEKLLPLLLFENPAGLWEQAPGSSSRRLPVPASPGCTSMPECKIIQRTRQNEDAPDGPNIPPSGRRYYTEFVDKRCPQTVFSSSSFQSPIKINIFTQITGLIIAAYFLEYAFSAKLTGSLSHASKKPDNTPKL